MSSYNFLKNARTAKNKIPQSEANLALENNDMAKEIATGNTASSVNKVNAASDLKLSNYADYTSESNLNNLNNKRLDAINEIENSQYQSSYQDLIDNTLNEIVNGKTYDYNVNEDPLYQQYEELYRKNAALANENAQGTAAALTGGYGNTYAQTVGQQTYQNYMDQLNEAALSLENQAYSRHQDDLTNEYNILSALQNADSTDYNKYINDLSKDEYLSEAYNNLFSNAESSKNYQDETKYNHEQDGIDNYFQQLSYDIANKEYELNAEDMRHDNALADKSQELDALNALYALSNSDTESEKAAKIGDSANYNAVNDWVKNYITPSYLNDTSLLEMVENDEITATEAQAQMDRTAKALTADDNFEIVTYLENAILSGAISEDEADSILSVNNIDYKDIVTVNDLIEVGIYPMTKEEFAVKNGQKSYEEYLTEEYEEYLTEFEESLTEGFKKYLESQKEE